MSSFELAGVNGALFGPVAIANHSKPDILIHHNRPGFLVCNPARINEQTLRTWFSTLLNCWPPSEEFSSYNSPFRRVERWKKPPDIGFVFTGNVNEYEGFAVSWLGGTVRGSASGCLLACDFDVENENALKLRHEIEDYYGKARVTKA